MTKKLVWRLANLPNPSDVAKLVTDGIISQEEARDILFSSETKEDRDKKSLESEIQFLRDLVEKLSSDRSKVVEVIRTIEKPYYDYHWYRPYAVWCSNTPQLTYGTGTTLLNTNAANTLTLSGTTSTAGSSRFSSIKTF